MRILVAGGGAAGLAAAPALSKAPHQLQASGVEQCLVPIVGREAMGDADCFSDDQVRLDLPRERAFDLRWAQ